LRSIFLGHRLVARLNFQRLARIRQIGRVKAFSEPPVCIGKETACVRTPALSVPQSAHAHGGAKFKGFGSIFLSPLDCDPETPFSLFDVIVRRATFAFEALQEKFAFESMKFRLPGPLFMLAYKGQCMIHRAQTLRGIPCA
jgi:hypothetical protein